MSTKSRKSILKQYEKYEFADDERGGYYNIPIDGQVVQVRMCYKCSAPITEARRLIEWQKEWDKKTPEEKEALTPLGISQKLTKGFEEAFEMLARQQSLSD